MHKYDFDATITLNIQDIFASQPKTARNENLFNFLFEIIIEWKNCRKKSKSKRTKIRTHTNTHTNKWKLSENQFPFINFNSNELFIRKMETTLSNRKKIII